MPTMKPNGLLQLLPGSTLESTCRTLFLITLPSSGSLAIIVMKFLASFSVMCGGSGGTLESV